jgi:hypothetical protein
MTSELDELEELEELDELELDELDDVVVLWVTAAGYSTAYKVTTLQVEPRLYWNLGVKTARTPLQSANKSVYHSKIQENRRVIPEEIVAPRTERDSTHMLSTATV